MRCSRNRSFRSLAVLLAAMFLLTVCPRLVAQEVGFWDLTNVAPRNRARQPRSGRYSGGGVGGSGHAGE
jgi:hypothetical protein